MWPGPYAYPHTTVSHPPSPDTPTIPAFSQPRPRSIVSCIETTPAHPSACLYAHRVRPALPGGIPHVTGRPHAPLCPFPRCRRRRRGPRPGRLHGRHELLLFLRRRAVLRPRRPADRDGRQAHRRHLRPRLLAVDPRQRPGLGRRLRVRRHLRAGRGTRLQRRQRPVGARHLRFVDHPRRQGLGPEHSAVLHHRRAQERRRLHVPVLHDHLGDHHQGWQPGRQRDIHRGPQGRPHRRPGRHDVAAVRLREPRARTHAEAADVQLLRRHGPGPTDGPRGRDRRRPADRVLHGLRADR